MVKARFAASFVACFVASFVASFVAGVFAARAQPGRGTVGTQQ